MIERHSQRVTLYTEIILVTKKGIFFIRVEMWEKRRSSYVTRKMYFLSTQ